MRRKKEDGNLREDDWCPKQNKNSIADIDEGNTLISQYRRKKVAAVDAVIGNEQQLNTTLMTVVILNIPSSWFMVSSIEKLIDM